MPVSIQSSSKCVFCLNRTPGGSHVVSSIVAVHGLYGDSLGSWTARNAQSSWLCHPEMLPKSIPRARILTWGYDAEVTAFLGDTSSDRILQHAQTLIAHLQADREVLSCVKWTGDSITDTI